MVVVMVVTTSMTVTVQYSIVLLPDYHGTYEVI